MQKAPEQSKKQQYALLIQEFFKKHQRVPRRREFKNFQAIANTFGGWNKAVRYAGFEVTRDFQPTRARLRNSLLEFYSKHKRPPKTKECTKANNLYDHKTYIKFLGVSNWAEVLEYVGLDRFLLYSKLTTNKELAIKEITEFIKTEKITMSREYQRLAKQKGLPSLGFIHSEYGGWENLLRTVGLKQDLTKEMIVNSIRSYHKKNGKSPSAAILAKRLRTTIDSIRGKTGNYNDLLKELNLPLNKQMYQKNTLKKDELKKMYIEFSIKQGFPNGAPRLVLNKFNVIPNASVFIKCFGSMSDLRRDCGFMPFNEYNAYSPDDVIELLKQKYISLHRPLKSSEIIKDKQLPSISTILRYTQKTTLKDVWHFIKSEVRNAN